MQRERVPAAANQRYLTPAAKDAELAEWRAKQAAPLPAPPEGRENLGGRGWPDPEIFEACELLNALPGVCTLQSCSGHPGDGPYVNKGHLWIWPSEEIATAFYRRAFELALHPRIEQCKVRFQGYGREVIDIDFDGLESGEGMLEESTEALVAFFEALG